MTWNGVSQNKTRNSKYDEHTPPPPTPCTHLPARSCAKFCAAQQTIVPMVNSEIDINNSGRRPKLSDKETRNGWNTALVKRYVVPIQNASADVPFRSLVISCLPSVQGTSRGLGDGTVPELS